MLDHELINRTLSTAMATGGEFAEVFVEDKRSSSAMLDDGRVEELTSGRDRGAGIRVVVGDTTGFAHTADLSEAFFLQLLLASWEVFVEMAPFLVLGFLVAGFLSQWLAAERLSRWIARDDLRSVGVASVVGAPLPLCSCSVVPVAASLRRAGAGKGATSAFLVATPETGVDSISVTYGLLDPLMTLVRPLASVLSAIATGLAVNVFVRSGSDDSPEAGLAGGAGGDHEEESLERTDHDHHHHHDHAHDHHGAEGGPEGPGLLRRALRYAFVEMLEATNEGRSWEGILGVWFKKDGQTVKNLDRPSTKRLDAYPWPDRRRLPRYDEYYLPGTKAPMVTTAITSRGCPHSCPFCLTYKKQYRIRDIDNILDNLEFTLMGTFDVRKGRWGFVTDAIYMDVGNSKTGTREASIGRNQIPIDATANVNLDIESLISRFAFGSLEESE